MENLTYQNIPLLGEDGRRPILNLKSVRRHLKSIIKTENVDAFLPLSHFTLLPVISRGPTGYVLKAEDKNGDECALKRIQYNSDGWFPNAFNEVDILKSLKHKNIIALENLVTGKELNEAFMCLEYCREDLTHLLENVSPLDQAEVKCLMKMLMNGVTYMHGQHILHRDISPSHLLIHASGMLKLACFGKAVLHRKNINLSCKVGTPGFRAPELIMDCGHYTFSVDMWSVGCISGQLLLNRPVFLKDGENGAQTDAMQMNKIIRICGPPTQEDMPSYSSHPIGQANSLLEQTSNNFRSHFKDLPVTAIDLLKEFFVYNTSKRITTNGVLRHRYFSTSPEACPADQLMLRLDKKRKRPALVNYSESDSIE